MPRLAQRPMHTDEAVHAIKFGALLEENKYRYDPHEYHGPALNYFTLIPSLTVSPKKLAEIDERTLRIVPVFFGMFLFLGLFLLKNGLSRPVVFFASLFLAISPAMVFYSRYYIQEMLLVSFSFGAIVSGYRYVKSKNYLWAVSAGVFLGLMHATKETSIIAFGAMLLALFLTGILQNRQKGKPFHFGFKINPWHILIFTTTAFVISAMFYSSFLTHPRGVLDSFFAYKNYLQRAGQNSWHIHPWFYYFKLLIGSKHAARPFWNELLIVILSGIGLAAALRRKQHPQVDQSLFRFIAIYTVILALIYSIIPYKTPWSMLGFYHGMILLAAIGATSLLTIKMNTILRIFIFLFLVLGVSNLLKQSYLSNFKYEADPSNPYIYAHTSRDIFVIAERIEEIATIHPDGKNMVIEVICPEDDYWPLPWYLRFFPNVGWWNRVNFSQPAAQVIIAFPSVESELLKKLYEWPPPGERSLYLPLFRSTTELRPQVEIRGYVTKELMDLYIQRYSNLDEE
ncbi:MAG: TIGR03663 family protein [Candidatus Aminicenantes bacterium]|nr:TIGR03663 family protein [Candidatus Aminicenantes bacterium]